MIEDAKTAVEGVLGQVSGLVGGVAGGEMSPTKMLGGARVAIGVLGVATPGLAAWVSGLRPGRNPSAVFLMRLSGATNAALGAGLLVGPADATPLLVQLGLATDVVGLFAVKRARSKGDIGLRATLVYGLKELGLAGLGGAVLTGKA